LFGAGTWTLREVFKEYVENFQMWCWRRMEKTSVRNEALQNNATLLGEFPKILTLPEMKLGSRNIVASLVSRLWNGRSRVGIPAV